MSIILPNPDCEAGKHENCYGDGWDALLEQPAPCPCDCHQMARDDQGVPL